jgi:flagellar hook-basal body complex protein FliE
MDATRITSQGLLGLEGLSRAAKPAAPRPEESFATSVGKALSSANDELNKADASARELATGKGDLVETMIDLGRADLSLRMVVNLRNRMLESYQEIMRLQV